MEPVFFINEDIRKINSWVCIPDEPNKSNAHICNITLDECLSVNKGAELGWLKVTVLCYHTINSQAKKLWSEKQ